MDNTQMWFIKRLDDMNLSKEKRQKYNSVFENNMNSIFHLTDNDKDYSKSEIKEKANRIFAETDKEVKPFLNKKQFKQHLKTADILRKAYMKRLDHPSDSTSLGEYLNERTNQN